MNLRCLFFLALSTGGTLISPHKSSAKDNDPIPIQRANHIVENNGQIIDQYCNKRYDIDFGLTGKGVNLFVGSGHLHYQWSTAGNSDERIEMYRMDIQFLGANEHAEIVKEKETPFIEHHYSAFSTVDAKSYNKVVYKNIYPNIDWVLYLKDGIPEYDFIIHPGGNVSDINMRYGGAQSLNVQEDGSLKATTPMGYIVDHAPYAFQSNLKQVAAAFVASENTVSFKVAPYDGVLTIDPSINWGTYLGGMLSDQIYQTVCDDSGYVYVAGSTASTANIATTGSYQTTYGGGTGAKNYLGDAFAAKFNAAGQCLWSTYYGGSNTDQGMSIALDTGRNVYLTGFTQSTSGIATTGSHQDVHGGSTDAFLVKLSNSGSRLWATYYGGSGNENTKTSVSCDTSGNVYLSGVTTSTSGIASSVAYQTAAGGGNDAFLAKFNSAGVRQWATYYGGSGSDIPFQHTNDIYGNIYLTGFTASTSGIASSGAYLSTAAGADDGFLVKFNSSGQRIWGTYFGGSLLDRSFGVVCDDSTHVFMTGITRSTSGIATSGAHLTTHAGGTQDAYLCMFDSSGAIQWSTYYGGAGNDVAGASITRGLLGAVYLCGSSTSTSGIATTNGISSTISGVTDAYITKFTHSGLQAWGSYIGGLDVETAYSVATDLYGNLYVAGQTNSSTGIATSTGYQSSIGGGAQDGFLVKIYDCDTPAQPVVITGPSAVCKGQQYKYWVPKVSGVTSYAWSLPSGWSGTSNSDTILIVAGSINGHITATPNTPCISGPSQSLTVTVNLVSTITPSGYHEICSGDSIVLTANSGTGYIYQWLQNNAPITGALMDKYAAKTSGLYSVIITGASCTDTSLHDTIHVNPLPQPIVTLVGTDLTTTAFVSYQWYHSSVPITGAVGQIYTPLTDGYYAVSVTDTNGCTAMSAYFPFGDVTGVDNIPAQSKIRVYPNPATDLLQIDLKQPFKYRITDALGRSVGKGVNETQIDIHNLSQGVYIIQFTDIDHQFLGMSKFLKK